MLFNTLIFAIFFTVVYILYLCLNHKWQNWMLLVASYIFYGWWDWRFLSLIFISTVLGYFFGIKIYETTDISRKKWFLFIDVFCNLAILGFFKYYNFFAESLQGLLSYFGFHPDLRFMNIILPVGISFYTFQTMSYSLDIYKGGLKPTRHFFDFALFVAFFPQLVAGPIERASHLLPQIIAPRKLSLEKFYEGGWLIFLGLFMKVCVADNLAKFVDPVFAQESSITGAVILIGLYAYAFQIFCDFAGYSNIARGLGKCMGFDIMVNFRTPYFSKNPQEFWQQWHISLSSWLRDYLYIPLGGNRKGPLRTYCNLFLTMFLGGLWHGASWHFVLWGIYQGAILIVHRLFKEICFGKKAFFQIVRRIPLDILKKGIYIFVFFHITTIGWVFFRTQSVRKSFAMLLAIFTKFSFTSQVKEMALGILWFIVPILCINIFEYKANSISFIFQKPFVVRTLVYFILLLFLLIYGVTRTRQFIYFQF